MPEVPNTSYDVAYQAASRESLERTHLQGILANARATQQQAADIKAKQEEQTVDTNGMSPEAIQGHSQFAIGAVPGTSLLRFKDSHSAGRGVVAAKELDDRKADDDGAKNTVASVMAQWPAGGPKGPPPPRLQAFLDQANGKRGPARTEAIKQLQTLMPKFHAPGTTGSDPYTDKPIEGSTIPYTKDDPAKERKGISYMDEVITLLEQGVPADDPRVKRAKALARYGRQSLSPEGSREYDPTEDALKGIGPIAGPTPTAPAQPAPLDILTKTIAAAQQALADPNIPADKKQAIQEQLAAALKLQASNGVASAAPAAAPAPAVAPPLTNQTRAVNSPKPATAESLESARALDSTAGSIKRVRELLNSSDVQRLRGGNSWVGGLLERTRSGAQEWSGVPLGTPSDIISLDAAIVAAVSSYRESKGGKQLTPAEKLLFDPLLAKKSSDPGLLEKLDELEKLTKQDRDLLARTWESTRRAGPATPPAPAAKPPSAGVSGQSKQWTRDGSGKLVPR